MLTCQQIKNTPTVKVGVFLELFNFVSNEEFSVVS